DYPISWLYPARVAPSHWMEHIPFAMALIDMVRPRVFVELGTYYGASYCAFCQAITHLGLSTQAYAVDTWKGDAQNGYNGTEVLDSLKAYHDPLYGSFSRLIPSTFDEALGHFPDGAIDLLHIDGYHNYESVTHDFETWLPKMSDRGVILFHDINVREFDFGVWKLWAKVKDCYPSFEFSHQHGLGVLAVGPNCPEALYPLLEAPEEEQARIRAFYFHLGQRITGHWERSLLRATLAAQLEEVRAALTAQLEKERAAHATQLAARQAPVAAQGEKGRAALAAQLEKERAAHATQLADRQATLMARLEEERAALTAQLEEERAAHATRLADRQAAITSLRNRLA